MVKPIAFAFGVLITSQTALASPVTCEKAPPVPEWAIRGAEQMDALMRQYVPKADGIHNTFPAKINGKDLVLHYVNYRSSASPAKGTIVYLCGGPGVPCNANGRPFNMPKDYDVLVMDYLGIGENNKFNAPEQMAIESQGDAVVQLVNYLKAKNLVVYGHSFGTTVATVAASKLTSAKNVAAASLKGVFLEGVVGKGDYKKYDQSFARAADTAWGLLSETEKAEFKKSYTDVTQKLNAKEVESLNSMLSRSVVDGSLKAKEALKKIRSDMNLTFLKDLIKNREMRLEFVIKGDGLNQIRASACQIVSASQDSNEQKIFGGLVTVTTPVPKGVCDCKTLSKMWDPAEYSIKGIPVIYVNGQQDPNTAFEWAQGHYQGQTGVSDKVMISPKYGGHVETYLGVLKTCTDSFFESLEAQDLSRIKSNRKSIEEAGCSPSGSTSPNKSAPRQNGVE